MIIAVFILLQVYLQYVQRDCKCTSWGGTTEEPYSQLEDGNKNASNHHVMQYNHSRAQSKHLHLQCCKLLSYHIMTPCIRCAHPIKQTSLNRSDCFWSTLDEGLLLLLFQSLEAISRCWWPKTCQPPKPISSYNCKWKANKITLLQTWSETRSNVNEKNAFKRWTGKRW